MATTPASNWIIRTLYAFVGVVFIGLGAAILQVGGVGVDPYTALNIGVSDSLGWSLGAYQALSNLVLFAPVLIWGRKYIGSGTVINMLLTGFFIDWFAKLLAPFENNDGSLLTMMLFFIVGILIFDFGASAYMSAGVGTAPYDAIAPLISEKTGWQYQRVRVPQDLIVLVLAVLAHGPVGFGTIMTAFFNGPLIQFFTTHVNKPLVAKLVPHPAPVESHPHAGRPGDPTQLLDKDVDAR